MKIGMVGLGRMGANMTKRLVDHGHEVVAWDRNAEAVDAAAGDGAIPASDLRDLVGKLEAPRAVWVMLPAGPPTVDTVNELSTLLAAGDTIVEGGNSHFGEAVDFAARLQATGIGFVDAGVSGGVWGLKNGYCLMVGGEAAVVEPLEPIFHALAPEEGYAHVGPAGAGHFSKMIHNGIEYGMLQAYAEGFALLQAAPEFGFDIHQLAKLWNHGSVIQSWLLELAELAFGDEGFSSIRGHVADSGEGRWTVQEAVNRAVSAPVITAALFTRFESRDTDNVSARIVAALRNQFGGHAVLREAAAAEINRQAEGSTVGVAGPEAAGTAAAETTA